jgi:hypothetical protein
MNKGFYSMLFLGITGYGVWLQQSYMALYSQEFELQQSADRSNAPFLSTKNLEIKEYKNGVFTSHFRANEAHFLNNGQLSASGNLRFTSLGPQGKRNVNLSTSRLLGLMNSSKEENNSFSFKSGIAWLSFPAQVRAISGEDTIVGSNILYKPTEKIIQSPSPVRWDGNNRNFAGNGFRYALETGDFSVGGPVSGTFLPTKDDFSSFGARR